MKKNVVIWLKEMEALYPNAFGKLLNFTCKDDGIFDTMYQFFKSENIFTRWTVELSEYEKKFKDLEDNLTR